MPTRLSVFDFLISFPVFFIKYEFVSYLWLSFNFCIFQRANRGFKIYHGQNRKEGSSLRQFRTQLLKNINFHIFMQFYLKILEVHRHYDWKNSNHIAPTRYIFSKSKKSTNNEKYFPWPKNCGEFHLSIFKIESRLFTLNIIKPLFFFQTQFVEILSGVWQSYGVLTTSAHFILVFYFS